MSKIDYVQMSIDAAFEEGDNLTPKVIEMVEQSVKQNPIIQKHMLFLTLIEELAATLVRTNAFDAQFIIESVGCAVFGTEKKVQAERESEDRAIVRLSDGMFYSLETKDFTSKEPEIFDPRYIPKRFTTFGDEYMILPKWIAVNFDLNYAQTVRDMYSHPAFTKVGYAKKAANDVIYFLCGVKPQLHDVTHVFYVGNGKFRKTINHLQSSIGLTRKDFINIKKGIFGVFNPTHAAMLELAGYPSISLIDLYARLGNSNSYSK